MGESSVTALVQTNTEGQSALNEISKFCVARSLQKPTKFLCYCFISSILEGDDRERSHERIRYSPRPYEDNRRTYYHDRESSPYESHRHSPPREKYEPRDKPQER